MGALFGLLDFEKQQQQLDTTPANTRPIAIPPTNQIRPRPRPKTKTKKAHTSPTDRQVIPVISNNNKEKKKKASPPTTNSSPRNPPKPLEEELIYVFSTIAELIDDDTVEYIAGMLEEDHSDDDTREFVSAILKEAMPNARAGAVTCDRLFGLIDKIKKQQQQGNVTI